MPLQQRDVLVAKLRVPAVGAAVLHLQAQLALVDERAPLRRLRQLAVPGQAARPLREVAVVDQVVADQRRGRRPAARPGGGGAAWGLGRRGLASDLREGGEEQASEDDLRKRFISARENHTRRGRHKPAALKFCGRCAQMSLNLSFPVGNDVRCQIWRFATRGRRRGIWACWCELEWGNKSFVSPAPNNYRGFKMARRSQRRPASVMLASAGGQMSDAGKFSGGWLALAAIAGVAAGAGGGWAARGPATPAAQRSRSRP